MAEEFLTSEHTTRETSPPAEPAHLVRHRQLLNEHRVHALLHRKQGAHAHHYAAGRTVRQRLLREMRQEEEAGPTDPEADPTDPEEEERPPRLMQKTKSNGDATPAEGNGDTAVEARRVRLSCAFSVILVVGITLASRGKFRA